MRNKTLIGIAVCIVAIAALFAVIAIRELSSRPTEVPAVGTDEPFFPPMGIDQ